MPSFDDIIIGTGQAGPSLAAKLSAAGRKIAVIERKLFGGACVNTGCIPTKTLVASAYAARMARRAADYGVQISGPVTIDMRAVKARKDQISGKSRTGVEKWMRSLENCTVYQGHARFEAPKEVRVGDQLLSADRVFINVGGRAIVPDLPGIHDIPYLTNSSLLEVDFLPRHLVIIGGSYIGLEFGQMYRRFGSEVTIVEKGSRLVPREDEDVSDAIKQILEAEGIHVELHSECIHFRREGGAMIAGLDCSGSAREVDGSHILLAVGRRPNTDDLGLENAGIEIDPEGYIKIDDELHTSVSGVWALGDCNGHGGFTHTAYNDYEIVAANLLDKGHRRLSDRIHTYALFIDPPLGRAGMTDAEVRKRETPALIGQRPMTRVGRAVEKGESQGFMKITVDAHTHEILGAAILGPGGDEAIHCVLDVMYSRQPYETLQHAMHIHPTVCELIPTILGELKPLE